MTWRERFAPGGSFRGVAFLIESDGMQFGRRVELHQFPRRDSPWAEDLGRRAREFTIAVYVLGSNYDRDRDALIAAIEQPGAGTLVHPYHGTMQVTVVRASKSESTREGGICRFSLTCIESGELRFPVRTIDTAAAVAGAADAAQAAALEDFAATYDVSGQAQYSVDQVQADLGTALAAADSALDGIAEGASSVMRAPSSLGGALLDAVKDVAKAADVAEQMLALYERLFEVGQDVRVAAPTTANRRRQGANTEATFWLMRRIGVCEACRTASGMEFDAAQDALAVREQLVAGIDAQLEAVSDVDGRPVSDVVYQELSSLRAAIARDLAERGAALPRVTSYTPPATLPMLVVAHRIYADATRAEEIVTRNRVRHPGFVPGGQALEVLSDE
jgi:prophage DNA circulation protein